MALRVTESMHRQAKGLDALPDTEVLARLHDGQAEALAVVRAAIPDIAKGARLMADTLRGAGRLVYGGAGSSALMALADALELPGTYNVPPSRIDILMAGGLPGAAPMLGHTEDDIAAGTEAGTTMTKADLLIVLTASGSTPYALGLAAAALAKGARIVAITNTPGSPILDGADAAICLATPPELVAGSTRMGAGTAQKAALNMMSTLMGVHLGAIFDGMMVDLIADNAKLRARAVRIVATIADVPDAQATAALDLAQGAAKPAVLVAKGASPDGALALLADTGGNLRAALARMAEAA